MCDPRAARSSHPSVAWLCLLSATALALAMTSVTVAVDSPEPGAHVRLVSFGSAGGAADGRSAFPDIDDEGRFVVFESAAGNIDPRDDNTVCRGPEPSNCWDLFVHDLWNSTTTLVSRSADGTQAAHSLHDPTLSGDGRFVAFRSLAPSLVSDDDNQDIDSFVLDVRTGATELVTRDWRGHVQESPEGPSCSPGCGNPMLSRDGRFVAFSTASNGIVPDDDNDLLDVYRLDRRSGDLIRVSQGLDGQQPDGDSIVRGVASMSSDGRFIVFASEASNLVGGELPACSGNAFGASGPRCWQVYLFDAQTNATTLVSTNSDGLPGNNTSGRPAVSGDGGWIYFQSRATNLDPRDQVDDQDVYGVHRQTGETLLVSDAPRPSGQARLAFEPTTNHDGSVVAFLTDGPEYGATGGHHGVVATQPGSGTFVVVSRNLEGGWANDHAGRISMSADGRTIVFFSGADDLVARPTYQEHDRIDVYAATNPMFPDATLPVFRHDPGMDDWVDAGETPAAPAMVLVGMVFWFAWTHRSSRFDGP